MNEPSQVTLVTQSNQGTKRESHQERGAPNLPPIKDKIKMISGGGVQHSNDYRAVNKSFDEKKSSDRTLSQNDSGIMYIKPPRPFSFGKSRIPPIE